MESKERNTDKLFREKFHEFEAETPYNAWPDIQEKLNRGRRKKRIIFWRYSSIAAAVLLAFFTGYYFQDFTIDPDKPLKETGTPGLLIPQEKIEEMQESSGSSSQTETEAKSTRQNNSTHENSAHPPKDTPADRSDFSSKAREKKTIPDPVREWNEGAFLSGNEGNSKENKREIHIDTEISNETTTNREIAETASPSKELPDEAERGETVFKQENSGGKTAPSATDAVVFYDTKKGSSASESAVELSLLGGPSIPFRNVNFKKSDALTEQNVQNENLENSYAGGFRLAFKNSNWEWQAGLMVSNWQQSSNNILLQSEAPVSNSPATGSSRTVNGFTSSGDLNFIATSSTEVALDPGTTQFYLIPNISQEYQFIDVPIGAAYYIINKKFLLKAQAGINPRFLSNSNVKLQYPDGTTKAYDGLRPNDFSLQLSAGPGFGYRVTKRLKLQVDPLLYYGITPISDNRGVTTYHHQFLIFSGFSYRF